MFASQIQYNSISHKLTITIRSGKTHENLYFEKFMKKILAQCRYVEILVIKNKSRQKLRISRNIFGKHRLRELYVKGVRIMFENHVLKNQCLMKKFYYESHEKYEEILGDIFTDTPKIDIVVFKGSITYIDDTVFGTQDIPYINIEATEITRLPKFFSLNHVKIPSCFVGLKSIVRNEYRSDDFDLIRTFWMRQDFERNRRKSARN